MSITPPLVAILLAGLTVLPLATAAQEPAAQAEATQVRLGTFDSRLVAIAYYRSARFGDFLAKVRAEHQRALAADDHENARRLEQEMVSRQRQIHRQSFSTEPIGEIVDMLEKQLPRIARNAKVDVIVSAGDLEYRHPEVQTIDLSLIMAEEFRPDAETRRVLRQMSMLKPVPLTELEQHED